MTKNQYAAYRRYKRQRRIQKIIASVMIVVALLTLPGAFYLDKVNLMDYSDGINLGDLTDGEDNVELDIDGLSYIDGGYGLPSGTPYSDKNVINILLLGTDDRTTDFSSNARSDSMILVSVNTKEDTVKLVSFERGTGVPVLSGQYEGQWDWLTHCFRYGGANLVLKEIQSAYLLDCTRYVRTNIKALVKIVDACGGVDIELTQAEADYINGNNEWKLIHVQESGEPERLQTVSPGVNHLNGVTAMVYARCRKIDSDWGRMGRQRTLLTALSNNIKGMSVKELNNLLNDILPLFQTNLTTTELASLMLKVPGVLSNMDGIETMALPADGTYGTMTGMGGRSLYAVNFEANVDILNEFLYDLDS